MAKDVIAHLIQPRRTHKNPRPHNGPGTGFAGALSSPEDRAFEIPTPLPRADSFSTLSIQVQLRVSRKGISSARLESTGAPTVIRGVQVPTLGILLSLVPSRARSLLPHLLVWGIFSADNRSAVRSVHFLSYYRLPV